MTRKKQTLFHQRCGHPTAKSSPVDDDISVVFERCVYRSTIYATLTT